MVALIVLIIVGDGCDMEGVDTREYLELHYIFIYFVNSQLYRNKTVRSP